MRWKWLVGSLIVAGLIVGLFAAEDAALAAPSSEAGRINLFHFGWGGGFCGQAGLEAAAEALDMTVDDLRTQLWGGRTLADLAEEAGVDLEDLRDTVIQACEQSLRDAIEQAVEAGRISREAADWLLEGLDRGFWGPRAEDGAWGWHPRFGGGRFVGPWGRGR